MIVLIDNTTTSALSADHINPLARDTSDADNLSLHVELRNNEQVQEAAASLVNRIVTILQQHGASMVVADAVKRITARGGYPYPEGVMRELEDMLSVVNIEGEQVAHAHRLEDRAADHMESIRRVYREYLVPERLREIDGLPPQPMSDGWEFVSLEPTNLRTWMSEPWRHPDELRDLSPWFAEMAGVDDEGDLPNGEEQATSEAAPAAV